MSHEYLALASEVKELESILTSIPQENVIQRLAFEERLTSAKSILGHMPYYRRFWQQSYGCLF
jgi:plasmid stabilization system protein ParE